MRNQQVIIVSFKPTTSSINRHVPFAIFVGFSSFPPWLFHLKMLGSPARWNSFVKLIQASPRPWKWKLRNGSSIRCWAHEKTTSCFCFYILIVWNHQPSSFRDVSHFFWKIAFEELSLDFINPIGCQVWQRSAQSIFFSQLFSKGFNILFANLSKFRNEYLLTQGQECQSAVLLCKGTVNIMANGVQVWPVRWQRNEAMT